MKGKAAQGNAQNVANMLWAFATLGEPAQRGWEAGGRPLSRPFEKGGWRGQPGSSARVQATGAEQPLKGSGVRSLQAALPVAGLTDTRPSPSPAGHHPGDDVMQALAEAVQAKLWEFTAQVGGEEMGPGPNRAT